MTSDVFLALSTASSSGVSRKLGNSAHIEMVYTVERFGHSFIVGSLYFGNSELGICSLVDFNLIEEILQSIATQAISTQR